MGIWTNKTFDYLQPSMELARAHLGRAGKAEKQWPDEGFHMGLVRQELKRFLTHPWSPLPMFRA